VPANETVVDFSVLGAHDNASKEEPMLMQAVVAPDKKK